MNKWKTYKVEKVRSRTSEQWAEIISKAREEQGVPVPVIEVGAPDELNRAATYRPLYRTIQSNVYSGTFQAYSDPTVAKQQAARYANGQAGRLEVAAIVLGYEAGIRF